MSRWDVGMLVLIALIAICVVANKAHAEPMYQADTREAKVTVHSEPCAIAAVGNLPKRATWEEKGKVFEGCAGQHPMYPVLVFYFSGDNSVVVIEVGAFRRLTGA